ncbi:MAG TPA: 4-hydroxyphenylacetate 3-hydroxylase N-terminal domain-containing protein [Dehalococcoidales bacterium]|nr:4-hydroxyphenylacetate 3-hydroxylase N-terminal domain-containing protein [Dehalococcoidales bacterium]
MIRTPEQYVESLNDGRVIYLNGERIPDITKHPHMKGPINRRAAGYRLANDPEWRDLITMEEDGERIMFLWKQPKTAEDLIRRRDVYINTMRLGGGISGMGPDALAAATVVATRMDKQTGTHYTDAIDDYRQHLRKTDMAITGAITDVKGNRGLRPSAQEQHQDFYVKVVDRQKDGIVVRGAKMHISDTPGANEIIVSPCRAHREEDRDCALVFATPLNAEGLKLLTSPRFHTEVDEEAQWNWPVSGQSAGVSECMIVFDDVFVPWNRVFMCGEWEFSRDIAWTFGVFHRLFGTCHKVISTELTAGVAALMAEYNGIDRYPHIQEKLAWLAMHAQIIDTMAKAACEHPEIYADIGLAAPNLMYCNVAKYMFANDQFETSKILCDITGGLVSTVHSYKDWMNPEERPYLEKYLAGKSGVPTEDRLRAVRMAKDLTDFNHDNVAIHGEGSLAAQKMAIYAAADWDRYKAIAKRTGGIPGWENHPDLKGLPPLPPETTI